MFQLYETSSCAIMQQPPYWCCRFLHSEQLAKLAITVGLKKKQKKPPGPNATQTSQFLGFNHRGKLFCRKSLLVFFGGGGLALFVKPPASSLTISLPLSAYLNGQTICPLWARGLLNLCKQTKQWHTIADWPAASRVSEPGELELKWIFFFFLMWQLSLPTISSLFK